MFNRTSKLYCVDTLDPDGWNKKCGFKVRGKNHHEGPHHNGIVASNPRKGRAKRPQGK